MNVQGHVTQSNPYANAAFGQSFNQQGFNGFHQLNPVAAGGVAAAPAFAAVPVYYPVAVMAPAFLMAYPQTQAAIGGGFASTEQAPTGAHVTANPTNSMASPQGVGGGVAGGAVGGFAAGYPVMLAPMFFQIGYPLAFAQGAVQVPQEQVAGEEPSVVVEGAPADPVAEIVEEAIPPAVAQVPPEPAVIDVVPQADEPPASLPNLPIANLNGADFAEYESLSETKEQRTELNLELTTVDGDVISLTFSQIDLQQMHDFNGMTLNGGDMEDDGFNESSDRVVNMAVDGTLSDAERGAVDEVLQTIVDVVNQFFKGSVGDAVSTLKTMEFDLSQLASLSLEMSMSKSAEVSKAYHDGGDHVHDLMTQNGDVAKALEFMATAQKRLVDVAKTVFDEPSAAKLIKSLVPPLLSEPLEQLREEVTRADAEPVGEAEPDDLA